ncbi:MAG: hypothetical protein RQ729_07780 [Wenzhouxiangellaceae bacterium]|nr:hypothetical protein [Wenzhouxiangellaceae bacterium]
MPRAALLLISALALHGALPARAQTGELNLLTDLGTPFPPGCLAIDLPRQAASSENILVDEFVSAPSAQGTVRDSEVRVQVWRVACADDGFSVVLVRLTQTAGRNPVVVPTVFADVGRVDVPFHEAQLITLPGSGNVGASGGILTTTGTTWMLAVQPVSIDGRTQFLPADYNNEFTLEVNWGNFSPALPEGALFTLDRFEPSVDPPQFARPVLNGRYSGQWIRPGAERQGLVLQIAEQIDANFVFAVLFTYLDGSPVWVVGNTGADQAKPGPVTIDDMVTLQGGAFITDSMQPAENDIPAVRAGSISIEPVDCNRIRVDYDFSPLGKGIGSMELQRLIRIAGYDCNPWR